MTATALAAAEIEHVDPERVRKVWAQRAARLAKVPQDEDEGEQLSLVLIQLGKEVYALEAQYVLDIRPVIQITPVPRTPDWMVGVVNLRGRIISVLDIYAFLNLPSLKEAIQPQSPHHAAQEGCAYLIVVEASDIELALSADDVLAVQSVSVNQVQDVVNTMMLNIRADYVRGIVPHPTQESTQASTASEDQARAKNKAMLVILDLPTLLADKRLIIEESL